MREINKSHAGSELRLTRGESFEVRLPENPTTGFRWRVHAPGTPVLQLQEDSFQHAAEAVGAGGSHCWRFHAVQDGSAPLEFEYRRSWDKTAAETFALVVIVGSS